MSSETFEVFYDGDCPLCVREIKTLRKLDRKDRIVFTDIAAQGFDARVTGLSQGELMASIRGRMPDGTPVEGVEVFRQLYGAVGLKPLIPLSRLPGIRQVWMLATRSLLGTACASRVAVQTRAASSQPSRSKVEEQARSSRMRIVWL